MGMVVMHQTETIASGGSIHKKLSAPEVHMKVLSTHADGSAPSADAQYLIDKRSESSRSAMTSESMVSMTSSSQMKKISFHSHVEASSSLERLTTELRTGETPSREWNTPLTLHKRRWTNVGMMNVIPAVVGPVVMSLKKLLLGLASQCQHSNNHVIT